MSHVVSWDVCHHKVTSASGTSIENNEAPFIQEGTHSLTILIQEGTHSVAPLIQEGTHSVTTLIEEAHIL